MTFEEFRATKNLEPAAEFAARVGYDIGQFSHPTVLSYQGGCYIELGMDGTFRLQLYQDEWESRELAELEQKLYEFATDEEII
jgi:hypothetical protein